MPTSAQRCSARKPIAFFQTICRLKLKSVPISDGRIGVFAPTSFSLLSASSCGRTLVSFSTSLTAAPRVESSTSISFSVSESMQSENFSLLLLLLLFSKSDDDDWFDRFPILRRRTETSKASDSIVIFNMLKSNEKETENITNYYDKKFFWQRPIQEKKNIRYEWMNMREKQHCHQAQMPTVKESTATAIWL